MKISPYPNTELYKPGKLLQDGQSGRRQTPLLINDVLIYRNLRFMPKYLVYLPLLYIISILIVHLVRRTSQAAIQSALTAPQGLVQWPKFHSWSRLYRSRIHKKNRRCSHNLMGTTHHCQTEYKQQSSGPSLVGIHKQLRLHLSA